MNMQKIIFVFICLILVSCTMQSAIPDPKEALTTALSTPVDDYSATYIKTSSTSGGETTKTFSVEVSGGELIHYEEKSQRSSAGYGIQCDNIYEGGDAWKTCSCEPWPEEKVILYQLETGKEAPETTSCLDEELPQNPDAMLKAAGLKYIQETSDAEYVSFSTTLGITCYVRVIEDRSNALWCFTDDNLLVTNVGSLGFHPVATYVAEYPYDETLLEDLALALGEPYTEEEVEEELTLEEKKDNLEIEIEGSKSNFEEVPYKFEKVQTLLDEKSLEMSESDYERIMDEIEALEEESNTQIQQYQTQLDTVEELLEAGDVVAAWDAYESFFEEEENFVNNIDRELSAIKVEIGRAIGLS